MYKDLKGLKIDKKDKRYEDFPTCIDGEIYISGSPSTGWETKKVEKSKVITQESITKEIQAHLNAKARKAGYDNIDCIAKFMGFDNYFRESAEALALLAANTWKYAENALVDIKDGRREMPKSIKEMLGELPRR